MTETIKVERKVRHIAVPEWLIAAGKILAPMVGALAVGYASFVGMTHDVTDLKSRFHDMEVKRDTQEAIMGAMDRRVSTLEVKQTVVERDLKDALARIEATIKDIQTDVKDLQKTRNAK